MYGRGLRTIPACAGQPKFAAMLRLRQSVYPRVCGQPTRRGPIIVQRRVYPRVCGATIVDLRGSYDAIGLSPRVRGNPLSGTGQSRSLWSIPACAGQPGRPLPASLRRWVYPRVCGATSINPPSTKALVGLSPRVRGNLLDGPIKPKRGGSIPACAGQPIVLPTYGHSHEVYPRVCGATSITGLRRLLQVGLSPRVRGNLPPAAGHPHGDGSIPACAGQPAYEFRGLHSSGVYPRVCGATVDENRHGFPTKGLSPRVRGNPFERMAGHSSQGSIPACAGQPWP